MEPFVASFSEKEGITKGNSGIEDSEDNIHVLESSKRRSLLRTAINPEDRGQSPPPPKKPAVHQGSSDHLMAMHLQHQMQILCKMVEMQAEQKRKICELQNAEFRPSIERARGIKCLDRRFYITWLFFVTLSYHYNAWSIPLRESFLLQKTGTRMYWMTVDYLCDLVYLLDVVVFKPKLMFFHEGLWVRDTRLTRSNYWKKLQSKLDVVSLFPLDILYLYYGTETPLLRLPRLLKFQTAKEFYTMIESLMSSFHALRIGRSLFYLFYFIHLNACALYKNNSIANIKDHHRPYLYCFYFAVKGITSPGRGLLGSIHSEFTFTMFLSRVSGIFAFAFLIGQIRDIVHTAAKAQMDHQNMVARCVQHLKKLNMPKSVIQRVTDWFAYKWKQQHFFDESRILNSLPYNMRSDVALAVHMSTLSRVQVFRDCSESLLRDLVLQLRPVSFLPGDVVVRRGDVGHHMYIVKSGECCVLSEDEREVLATLREGCVFGEISLLGIAGARRRTATVRSRGYSSLFALSKADLDRALRHHREAALVLRHRADTIMRENAAREAKQRLQEMEMKKRLRRQMKKNKNTVESIKADTNSNATCSLYDVNN